MPIRYESPVAIPVHIGMVVQTALRTVDARELTEENFDQFWGVILADNILMVENVRIADTDEVTQFMVREAYRDLIGFFWWRS